MAENEFLTEDKLRKINTFIDSCLKTRRKDTDYNMLHDIAGTIAFNVKVGDRKLDNIDTPSSIENTKDIALKFFEQLDTELYEKVKNILDGKSEYEFNMYYLNEASGELANHTNPCVTTIDGKSTIYMPCKGTIEDIYLLVHELSHTFDNPFRDNSARNLLGEVTPHCFELMLSEFLKKNNLVDQKDILTRNRANAISQYDDAVDTFAKIELMRIKEQKGEISVEDIRKLQQRYKMKDGQLNYILDRMIRPEENVDFKSRYMLALLGSTHFIGLYKQNPILALSSLKKYFDFIKKGNADEALDALGIRANKEGIALLISEVNGRMESNDNINSLRISQLNISELFNEALSCNNHDELSSLLSKAGLSEKKFSDVIKLITRIKLMEQEGRNSQSICLSTQDERDTAFKVLSDKVVLYNSYRSDAHEEKRQERRNNIAFLDSILDDYPELREFDLSEVERIISYRDRLKEQKEQVLNNQKLHNHKKLFGFLKGKGNKKEYNEFDETTEEIEEQEKQLNSAIATVYRSVLANAVNIVGRNIDVREIQQILEEIGKLDDLSLGKQILKRVDLSTINLDDVRGAIISQVNEALIAPARQTIQNLMSDETSTCSEADKIVCQSQCKLPRSERVLDLSCFVDYSKIDIESGRFYSPEDARDESLVMIRNLEIIKDNPEVLKHGVSDCRRVLNVLGETCTLPPINPKHTEIRKV